MCLKKDQIHSSNMLSAFIYAVKKYLTSLIRNFLAFKVGERNNPLRKNLDNIYLFHYIKNTPIINVFNHLNVV